MAKSIGNALKFGEAYRFNLSANPSIVLESGIVVVDNETNILLVGDGVTPGAVLPKDKIWEVDTLEDSTGIFKVVGDYILVSDGKYHIVGSEGVTELIIVDDNGILGWDTLQLYQGWEQGNDSIGVPRVRKDGNLVTIDAVLYKDKYSDWSPFRLPTWARPGKTMYLTMECDTGYGVTPLVIYPDGYLYPRKLYTKKVNRMSFQITYWIENS